MYGIFRPSDDIEEEQYNRVKKKVFDSYSSETITDKNKIVDICKVIYEEHENILKENIGAFEIEYFLTFVLEEYEKYAKVNSLYNNSALSKRDEENWLSYASHSRRGIKYLVEYLCQNNSVLGNKCFTPELNEIEYMSRVFISIEEMCSMYMRIDGYNFTFDDVKLILDESVYLYFNVPQDLKPENRIDYRYERSQVDTLLPKSGRLIDDLDVHSCTLESSFKEHLGVTYAGLIQFLRSFISNSRASVVIEPKSKVIHKLQEKFNISAQQAKLAIDGFTLSAENLKERKLFSPKQEYRAYHRGFFEFCINGSLVLVFSKTMASEALQILISNACYKILPKEWKTKFVEEQLSVLSNKAGKWFEDVLEAELLGENFGVIRSFKSYRKNNKVKKIPDNVGEIDFLGYLPDSKELFVIEAKNVRFNTEPRLYRDDISKFISAKKSYSSKFKKKYDWVVDNLDDVICKLNQNGITASEVSKVYKVMVILYPSPVEQKVTGFSCINFVKFVKMIKSQQYAQIESECLLTADS
ncbi:hypothetical protein [Pseudoalteromonas lipolytica]|uniref:NERD domain-containing protein n=1 Tax=Pseudoalteromonas lipolytica TaxID=570156 RepID=A0ABU8SPC0_9GAMM